MNKRVLTLLAIALAPACALAEDGVVLINQSALNAAGGSYPITQPGSYKLSGNLIVSAGFDGIDVSASNVTIDLNGFSITSLQSGTTSTGNGIRERGQLSNVRIHNGSLAGFNNGVFFISSTRVDVQELVVDALSNSFGTPLIGSAVVVGANSLVRHVLSNGLVQVNCPSIVLETVENLLNFDETNGNCVLWLNRNSVDASPVRF